MHLEIATEEGKKIAENADADADGILIFVRLYLLIDSIVIDRLFSVPVMISASIQDIQQIPQDASNFYLANIYQTLADPWQSNISSSLPTSPPPLSWAFTQTA